MLSSAEIEIIRSTFLFSGKSDGFIGDFVKSSACSVTTADKGETIWGQAQDKDRLGILLSGSVFALCEGRDDTSLKTFSAGELFGAATVFCDCVDTPFTRLRAKTRAKVLFISRDAVEKYLTQNPDKALDYISFLSGRVEFLNKKISTFTSEGAARLAKFLLECADESGVCRGVNFSALTKTLGISRASLYRARSLLIEQNAIRADGHTVTILDPEALKNIM